MPVITKQKEKITKPNNDARARALHEKLDDMLSAALQDSIDKRTRGTKTIDAILTVQFELLKETEEPDL